MPRPLSNAACAGGGVGRVADLALAFPGQGGDWRAGLAILDQHGDHRLVAALADRLGTDRWHDLDPLDTRNTQPVTYVAGLVAPRPAVDPDEVALVLGHSLGEITAAAWAGATSAEAGLDLVVARAALGHGHHAERPGAMAAFMRIEAGALDELRRQVLAVDADDDGDRNGDGTGVLVVAVTNSGTQHVLSGDERLVVAAVERGNQAGGVARRLAIGGAYHSPLLAPAVEDFRALAHTVVREEPAMPVVASTTGSSLTTATALADALADALVRPVDWPNAVSAAAALGARRAVDAGPGDTLSRLARFLDDDLSWS